MKLSKLIISKILHKYYEIRATIQPVKGRVLMFHSIGGAEDEFNVTKEEFRKILEIIKLKNVIRLENWEAESDFIALTFDDVPETFYKYAFPLLKKYNMPFTIFVSTSLIDTYGFISTNQLKEMATCNLCTVGSHGHRHSLFYEMDSIEIEEDLIQSKVKISKIIGKTPELYAFPYGSYFACGYSNKHLAGKVYKYCFGTIKAPITVRRLFKPYFLPRINVDKAFVLNFSEI